MLKRLVPLAWTVPLLAALASTPTLMADELVGIGSHRLQIHVEGQGSPTVVIDVGIGDKLDKVRELQARLAEVTRVVSYNRAGYGLSEPGPMPRRSDREAAELKALLEKAEVPGPYLLVGHSMGCLNLMMLAAGDPDNVAGMVLLDPPPLSFLLGEDYSDIRVMADAMTAEWQGIADSLAASEDPAEQAQAVFLQTIASEHREAFGEGGRLVNALTSFGDTPLIVMAAEKPNPAIGEKAEEFQCFWIEQSRALSTRSRNGQLILVEGASHYLYVDAPDRVVETIMTLLKQLRQDSGTASSSGATQP